MDRKRMRNKVSSYWIIAFITSSLPFEGFLSASETLNINDIFIQLFIKNGSNGKTDWKTLRDRQVVFLGESTL